MSTSELVLPDDPLAAALLEDELRRLREVDLARTHPAFLLEHVECIDRKTGERFEFQLLEEDAAWYWQRALLDWLVESDWSIILKGRQLGVTWVAAGLALWQILCKPGSDVLCYSINEDEAAKLVGRIWDMFESLPDHLKMGVKVLRPARGRPHVEIQLQHPDGRVSTVTGMASTEKAGRGRTAALIILDEFAFHQYAYSTWKSVIPAVADGGRVVVISTANGVSNDLTGGGNFFHHLWVQAGEGEYKTLGKRFLKWDLHPDRDEAWREALIMPADQKDEEYPNTPEDAFLLSGRPFFDRMALKDYSTMIREPRFRGFFDEELTTVPRRATFEKSDVGDIFVFELPNPDHDYVLFVDTATGRGTDFTVGAVLDLATGEPAAELHTKLDQDQAACQIHYLGRWYNDALIAVEMGGGYGETIIIELRHGRNGRPTYPRLYRHRLEDRPDQPESKVYGFPMTLKTRPQIVNGLERWIRERIFPYMLAGLHAEMTTFVHRESGTSPRAADGCNDDRVMAWGGAVELYRKYGHHPDRIRGRSKTKKTKRPPFKPYPWS